MTKQIPVDLTAVLLHASQCDKYASWGEDVPAWLATWLIADCREIVTEVERLRERVAELESGLRDISTVLVIEPVVATGSPCFGNPYDIRNIIAELLREKS